MTEAAWLMRYDPASVERLLPSSGSSFLKLLPLKEADAAPIAAILHRYRRLKPQLAGAALVHLSIRERIETVFTVEHRDFHI